MKKLFWSTIILSLFSCSIAEYNVQGGFKGTGIAIGFGHKPLSKYQWFPGYQIYFTTGYHKGVGNITWSKIIERDGMKPMYLSIGPEITSMDALGVYIGVGWLELFEKRNTYLEIGIDLLTQQSTLTAEYGFRF